MTNRLFTFLIILLPLIGLGQEPEKLKDNGPKKQYKRLKVDGVAAVVGDNVILDSDIAMMKIQFKAQEMDISELKDCELLGSLMENKLYIHHAVEDSITVSDAEVTSKARERISMMKERIGDMDKLLKYYKKSSEDELVTELKEILKDQELADRMQQKIIESVEITPEEVKEFYEDIPEADIPTIGTEVEISQIVLRPKASKEALEKVKNDLKKIKSDIEEDGVSFATKAVLYSEGPSRSSGGSLPPMTKKSGYVKEFKDIAFSLQEGQISEPFETEFGWHILQVDKVRGQLREVRHIVMRPKITDDQIAEARKLADSIRTRIIDKELTFSEAARAFSEEKETRYSGGVLINPQTGDKRFELSRIDPGLNAQVVNLKEGEISSSWYDEDRSGKMIKLLTVTRRIAEHKADYSVDYTKIRDLALRKKQTKEIGKWTQNKIKDTFVRINGEYRECKYASNWLKK